MAGGASDGLAAGTLLFVAYITYVMLTDYDGWWEQMAIVKFCVLFADARTAGHPFPRGESTRKRDAFSASTTAGSSKGERKRERDGGERKGK